MAGGTSDVEMEKRRVWKSRVKSVGTSSDSCRQTRSLSERRHELGIML